MNSVRWYIFNTVKTMLPDNSVHYTYGAATKMARRDLDVEKTHANDAYSMGELHPKNRTETVYLQKRRRNNRILQRFYDAKYIDSRDGSKQTGKTLFSGRINRNHNRDSENLHKCRAKKVSKGRTSIRKKRYSLQPGDVVRYSGARCTVKGCQHYGEYVVLDSGISVKTENVAPIKHTGGWLAVTKS